MSHYISTYGIDFKKVKYLAIYEHGVDMKTGEKNIQQSFFNEYSELDDFIQKKHNGTELGLNNIICILKVEGVMKLDFYEVVKLVRVINDKS